MKQGEKKPHKAHQHGEKDAAPHDGPSYAASIPKELLDEAVASVNGRRGEPDSGEIPIVEDAPADEARVRGLEGQIDALTRENAELRDRALRAAADLENYRKRSLREKDDFQKFAVEGLLRDLLPVADNVDQAMAHLASSDLPTVRTGVEMTYKSFLDALKKKGVTPFDAKGAVFDPNLHEAVQTVPSDDVPAGRVVAEVRRGYLIHDRLLRAAMVVVSTGRAGGGVTDAAPESENEPQG